MKIKILATLLLLICLSGFTTKNTSEDKYTYLLTIESLTDQSENFNLKIVTRAYFKAEPKEILMTDLKTPFEKKLEAGIYEITIETNKTNESVKGTVSGILEDQKWTWATNSNRDRKLIELQAGPGGRTGTYD